MHHLIADEAWHETAYTNNDDAYDERKRPRVDGGKRLATEDDSCDGEAKPVEGTVRTQTTVMPRCEYSLSKNIEDRVNDAASIARAISSDNHRAQASFRTKRANECHREGT